MGVPEPDSVAYGTPDPAAPARGARRPRRLFGRLEDLFGAEARAAEPAAHDGRSLRSHGLVWDAGARYVLDPDPLMVERRSVGVVVTEPAAGTALADVIVGLARPVAGTISLDEADVTRYGPARRRIALIPLGGGLLPHLSVAGNIAYAQGRAAAPRVTEMARRLHLSEVLRWHPHELSPVQRLRVAVARALCAQPEPVAVVIEDRDGHPACRAAVATACDQDLAVLVITDSGKRGKELSSRSYTARPEQGRAETGGPRLADREGR